MPAQRHRCRRGPTVAREEGGVGWGVLGDAEGAAGAAAVTSRSRPRSEEEER